MAGTVRRPRREKGSSSASARHRHERGEVSEQAPRRGRRRWRLQHRDWSGLPNPALFSILQRLPTFRDVFAFGGVCRAWRSVSAPVLPDLISFEPPILCASGAHHFYSFPHRRFYCNTLSALRRSDIALLGFFQGYLIMADAGSRREIWLANPFTGDELLSVPRISSSHSAEWAALTAPPSSRDCILVAWCRATVAYWKPGELHWSTYWCETEHERACGRWPAVVDGAIYARSHRGRLLRFEFLPQLKVTLLSARELLPGAADVWLVASVGEILAVRANLGVAGEESFTVYRLDRCRGEWEKVETLEGRALLFSPFGSGLCDERPDKWGGTANCIYYQWPPGGQVKAFSMEERRAQTLSNGGTLPSLHLQGACRCLGRCCSSSIWILPSLCISSRI